MDANVAMVGDGRLVEVQATAERVAFSRERMNDLLDLAAAGLEQIAELQREAAGAVRA